MYIYVFKLSMCFMFSSYSIISSMGHRKSFASWDTTLFNHHKPVRIIFL